MTTFVHIENYLENHAEIFSGIIIRNLKEDLDGKEVEVLELKDIDERGEVNIKNLKKIKIEIKEDDTGRIKSPKEKYFLKPKDIVIKAKSSSYSAGIMPEDTAERMIIPSSQLVVVRLKENAPVLPEFLWLFLNSKKGKDEIKRKTYGSIVRFVSTDTLKKIILTYPEESKQREAAELYKKMIMRDKYIAALKKLYKEEMEYFFDSIFKDNRSY